MTLPNTHPEVHATAPRAFAVDEMNACIEKLSSQLNQNNSNYELRAIPRTIIAECDQGANGKAEAPRANRKEAIAKL